MRYPALLAERKGTAAIAEVGVSERQVRRIARELRRDGEPARGLRALPNPEPIGIEPFAEVARARGAAAGRGAVPRLHARWRHLRTERRRPGGVAAVAIARELAHYCWELAVR